MKIRLELRKGQTKLLEATHSVTDATSFGNACADLWQKLEAKQLEQATSVGALMDRLGQNALELFDGAVIAISRA